MVVTEIIYVGLRIIYIYSPQGERNEHEKKRGTTHEQTDIQTENKQRTILYT